MTLSYGTVSSSKMPRRLLLSVLLLLSCPNGRNLVESQVVTCSNDADECEFQVGQGSVCRNGICTNPFESGCLVARHAQFNKTRICNSDDSPETVQSGICRPPSSSLLDSLHRELRIWAGLWESINFEAWLIQIILSELLDVPTTLETGLPDTHINFYHHANSFQYGSDLQVMPAVINAFDNQGRCRQLQQQQQRDSDHYISCAHFVPEIWNDLISNDEGKFLLDQGIVEPPQAMGVLGKEGWFVTKFTVQQDPTLVSYHGMQGLDDDNRQRLANTFLRPTTWKDYCRLVSDNNCTRDDGVAKRPPQHNTTEEQRMFVDGLYKGHFRSNQCDADDLSTCFGHIADYPCTWSSSIETQTHYLQIPLQSKGGGKGGRGYTYTQMQDMWRAANATNSNLIMYWWSPHALMEEFVGTDAEFQPVLLPTPTQQCLEARHTGVQRCSENATDRIGPPEAACDEQARTLLKVTSTTVYDMSHDPSVPEALRTPAHDVLDRFTLSTLQLGEIFQYSLEEPSLRQAVCRWAAENLDYLQRFVPPNYPRVVQEGNTKNRAYPALVYTAIGLACAAAILCVGTAAMVHRHRQKRAIRYAQVEFQYLLLAGLLLVSTGAIFEAVPPTNGICVASVWLVNLGYAFQLVPHIIKIGAINTLARASQRMRRVELKKGALFQAVALMCSIVVVFLILWTALLPPRKQPEYDLTTDVTDDQSTIVGMTYSCDSDGVFPYIAVGGTLGLLLFASVLAVQNRKVREDFNESQPLGIMIYSHVVFTTLRLVTILLPQNELSGATIDKIRSIIFSADSVATICIYFVPKLLSHDDSTSRSSSSDLLRPSDLVRESVRESDVVAATATACPSSGHSFTSWVGSTRFATLIRTEEPTVDHEHGSVVAECPNCGVVAEMRPLVAGAATEAPSSVDKSISSKEVKEDSTPANATLGADMKAGNAEKYEQEKSETNW